MEVPVGMKEVFSGPDDEEERLLNGYMDCVNLPDSSGRSLSMSWQVQT